MTASSHFVDSFSACDKICAAPFCACAAVLEWSLLRGSLRGGGREGEPRGKDDSRQGCVWGLCYKRSGAGGEGSGHTSRKQCAARDDVL